MRKTLAALAVTVIAASGANGIMGTWRAESGKLVRIDRCGKAFCVTVASGKYTGRPIGRFTGSNGRYGGTITDPKTGRTYAGTANLEGSSMQVEGCALRIFCKSQTWTKQSASGRKQ